MPNNTKTLQNTCAALPRLGLITVSLGFILLYVFLAWQRLAFPYELFWMEGASVDQVARILAGKNLYPKPSIEFVPYTYTGLYFYLSALIAYFGGLSFAPLRLVSFAASLGSLVLIYVIVKRETGSKLGALAAGGLYAATFKASGAWFDTARSDSLFLCLQLGAFYAAARRSAACDLLAGLLIWLAFLSKQVALPVSLPLLFYLALFERRQAARIGGSFLVLLLLSNGIFDDLTGGWYSFYVFSAPRHRWINHISLRSFGWFWTVDFAATFLPTLLLLAWYGLTAAKGLGMKKAAFLASLLAGLIGGACFGRMESINYINSLMPAHLALAIVCGLILGGVQSKSAPGVLILFQFLILSYDPRPFLPKERDFAQGQRFVSFLRSFKGEIYLPDHGYFPAMAGKRSYANIIGVSDVLLGDASEPRAELLKNIESRLKSQGFEAIILDSHVSLFREYFGQRLEECYRESDSLPGLAGVRIPVLGFAGKPQIYLPRPGACL